MSGKLSSGAQTSYAQFFSRSHKNHAIFDLTRIQCLNDIVSCIWCIWDFVLRQSFYSKTSEGVTNVPKLCQLEDPDSCHVSYNRISCRRREDILIIGTVEHLETNNASGQSCATFHIKKKVTNYVLCSGPNMKHTKLKMPGQDTVTTSPRQSSWLASIARSNPS